MQQSRRKIIFFVFLLVLVLAGGVLGADPIRDFFVKAVSAQNTEVQSEQTLPIFMFLRDLREGDTGNDVIELQKLLNTDTDTRISGYGLGSLGNETNYFGAATKEAVIRFQNKYADEILRPSGVSYSSGFVGFWTRLKLNQILLKSVVGQIPVTTSVELPVLPEAPETIPTSVSFPVPASSEPSASSNNFSGLNQLNTLPTQALGSSQTLGFGAGSTNANELLIYYPSKFFGEAGTSLVLYGSGFSSNSNTIHFGKDQKIEKVVAKNGALEFAIPRNIQTGRYDITVSNSAFKKPSSSVPFMVTRSGAVLPAVLKVEPQELKFGEKITVTGKNFAPTGNIITTSLGIFKDLKSTDGTTLTFSIPLPDYLDIDEPKIREVWFKEKDNLYWPVYVRVINENGVSEHTDLSKFVINL